MTSITSSSSDQKTHALIAYILMTIGLFTAIPLLAGAVWAMFTRRNAAGSIYHSHYSNAIRVFWWSLFWGIVGWATMWVLIGFAILGLAWLWALYRLVHGLVTILGDDLYPL